MNGVRVMRPLVSVAVLIAVAAAALAACSTEQGTPAAAPPTAVAVNPAGPTTTTAAPVSAASVEASRPYTATSLLVTGATDRATYNVTIPQIAGGDPAVVAEFNESMRTALQDQIDGFGTDAFTLEGREATVAHIGAQVISGLLVTSWNANPPGAHPSPLVATVVINSDNAMPVTLSDMFPDLHAGLLRLSEQSALLLPATAAGPEFDRNGIEPVERNFANWLATPSGMEIHFGDYQVGPHAVGLVTVTVPWSALADVLDPELAPVLSS